MKLWNNRTNLNVTKVIKRKSINCIVWLKLEKVNYIMPFDCNWYCLFSLENQSLSIKNSCYYRKIVSSENSYMGKKINQTCIFFFKLKFCFHDTRGLFQIGLRDFEPSSDDNPLPKSSPHLKQGISNKVLNEDKSRIHDESPVESGFQPGTLGSRAWNSTSRSPRS